MAASIRIIGNDSELDRMLNRNMVSKTRSAFVEVGEDNVCLPSFYKNYEERIRKFEVRDDDIFIAAHPKTGTTWAQEMIWLLVNNLNYEEAFKNYVYTRCPQLEFSILFDMAAIEDNLDKTSYYTDALKYIDNQTSPRCIKTHLHWSLLPEQIRNGTKKPKIITLLRSSEDTCVSLYHQSRVIEGYKGTFEEFCQLFMGGRVSFGPYWKQVLSFWNQRSEPNILFLKYKEMKEDLPGVLAKTAKFLGKEYTKEELQKLSEHLSFDSMKKNSSVNHEHIIEGMKKSGVSTGEGNSFIRKGQVGGYKSEMSPELIDQFKRWNEECLKGTGLSVE